jgi:hypothetical protein
MIRDVAPEKHGSEVLVAGVIQSVDFAPKNGHSALSISQEMSLVR